MEETFHTVKALVCVPSSKAVYVLYEGQQLTEQQIRQLESVPSLYSFLGFGLCIIVLYSYQECASSNLQLEIIAGFTQASGGKAPAFIQLCLGIDL